MIIIPTPNDLKKISQGAEYKNLIWYKKLKKITQETDTELFDLANYFTEENYKKMLHTCDNHWNSDGHSIVTNLIIKNFF